MVAVGSRRWPCRRQLQQRVMARPGDEGHVGGLMKVTMLDHDGQSMAMRVTKEAVATEGDNKA